jgi:streptogramin lyase
MDAHVISRSIVNGSIAVVAACATPAFADGTVRRSIDELKPIAVVQLGKTADWVAIAPDAVWIGSTGPDAVHRIDPRTNARVATVALDGEPCAGLAIGFGSLWVPLCGATPTLAKIDLATNRLTDVFKVGTAAAESGIATSDDSVWLVIDKNGTLARIDPATGEVRQNIRVPAGSFNPLFNDGVIWVTRAEGAEITAVDAKTGAIRGSAPTSQGPRFLAKGAGAIWTLNQSDGSLTRIDAKTMKATNTVPLATPGHGGDIAFGGGIIWTTMMKTPLSMTDTESVTLRCQWTGVGGDSLGIGHGAIWLTDYRGGTVSRFDLNETKRVCTNGASDAAAPSQR